MNNFDLLSRRLELWSRLQSAVRQDAINTDATTSALNDLQSVDRFWAYPGYDTLRRIRECNEQKDFGRLRRTVEVCVRDLRQGDYRRQTRERLQNLPQWLGDPAMPAIDGRCSSAARATQPYFEVLIVHPYPAQYEALYRDQLARQVRDTDAFLYSLVFVDSAQDALTALLANSDIQACVYLQHVAGASDASAQLFADNSRALLSTLLPVDLAANVETNLCSSARCVRPEIDHILISERMDLPPETSSVFDEVLFHIDPFASLHDTLMSGVQRRFATPVFDALSRYIQRPKAVFHALPVSQGASINDSVWTDDLAGFYGTTMLCAETSSTLGGLDSMQDPKGCIQEAYDKAARTFGADQSFFVTNGTSTSNKIVMQAHLRPGDIVLVAADCHKSVTHGAVQCGAYPVLLESYALPAYDLHGTVDLAQIKRAMLDLQRQGLLERVRMIVLTNSTFDGLVCHAEQYMLELLAIKQDLIFHWDEAWFAFGHFHPLYHSRTAMTAAAKLRRRLRDPDYLAFYTRWKQAFDADRDPGKWMQPVFPDPARTQVRVYATQSTHKTLSALRQGSMIHAADDRFPHECFVEALRMHTTTSPSYQIVASLDLARRQAALEGFRRVRRTLELALQLRRRIRECPDLRPYIRVLEAADLIPVSLCEAPTCVAAEREASINFASAMSELSSHWGSSQVVLDPTRITLDIRSTGLRGHEFRAQLMDRYDVQVNKTTDATILLVVTIGTSQPLVDYLVQVLQDMAKGFNNPHFSASQAAGPLRIEVPAPRKFHPAFSTGQALFPWRQSEHCATDIRTAFFDGALASNIEHFPITESSMASLQSYQPLVSAALVTPYPPGYPLLLPGQVVTAEIFQQLLRYRGREVHGLHGELGLRVFSLNYFRKSSEAKLAQMTILSATQPEGEFLPHAVEA
jgi:arginine decarboxylase